MLTAAAYLCHKRPHTSSVCRDHYAVLSSLMTYDRVCNNNNSTGATSGAGTAYPSGPNWFHSLICSEFGNFVIILIPYFYWS